MLVALIAAACCPAATATQEEPTPPPAAQADTPPTAKEIAAKAREALRNEPGLHITTIVTYRGAVIRLSRTTLTDAGWRIEALPYDADPAKRERRRCTAWALAGNPAEFRSGEGVAGPARPIRDPDDFWRILTRSDAVEYDTPEEQLLQALGRKHDLGLDDWVGHAVRETFNGVECWRIARNDIENANDEEAQQFWVGVEDNLFHGCERSDPLVGMNGRIRAVFHTERGVGADPALICEQPVGSTPLALLEEWRTPAERLYDAALERYATLVTYSDSASIRSGKKTTAVCRTHARRDGWFRVEFVTRAKAKSSGATRTRTWFAGDEGGIALGDRIEAADPEKLFDVYRGIGSVVTPYDLLFTLVLQPKRESYECTFFPKALGLAREIDGRPCRALLGNYSEEDETKNDMTLWIDTEKLVIRQIDATLRSGERLSMYVRPRIDENLPDELFQAQPPGLEPAADPEKVEVPPDPAPPQG